MCPKRFFILFFILNLCGISLFAQSTNVAIGNTATQTGVKRLGINLGGLNYYDSAQIMKNLTLGNPGFEATMWHSSVQCSAGSTTSCVDANIWSGWTSGYWAPGSTVQVISGVASGCSTTISSYTGPNNGAGGTYTFASPCSAAIGAGDYILVEQTINSASNPTFGYWPSTSGNGKFSLDTTDLKPGTTGVQALTVSAPAAGDSCSLSDFFDADSNGRSFVNLNGTFQITFAAKGFGGSQQVKVSFYRGGITYTSQIVSLSSSWNTYTVNFTASETGAQTGNAQLNFSTVGPDSFYLDDIAVTQTNTNSNNPSAFRDSVVSTLQTLQPGIIRMWDGAGLGNTLDNMLMDQYGRQPVNYSAYYQNYYNGVSYSIPEFLQLVQTVGNSSEPWVVVPITMTPAEASNLIDYLSGDGTTVYGAKRIAQGFTTPWTQVFPKIHLEFGNEAWNSTFDGGNIKAPDVYGARAQTIFAAMKANSNYDFSHTSLVLGGFFADANYVQRTQNACNNNDEMDVAPYMLNNPTDLSTTANLLQPMLAEPQAYYANGSTYPGVAAEWISQGYFNVNGNPQTVQGGGMYLDIQAEANSNHPVPISIYEENLSTTGGNITQAQLNTYVPSMAAGLATISEELLGIQNGVLNQNLFSLTQYDFTRPDGSTVPLWGSVIDIGGPTNLRRPQFLAEQMANSAISAGGSMLQTQQSGANPTWNQAMDNTVAMNGVNYIQSFAFNNGSNGTSVILLNLSLTNALPVTFSGANAPNGTVQMQQLTSQNPTDSNENSNLVSIASSSLNGFNPSTGLSLPPYSMTVLTWNGTNTNQSPVISAVTASAVTGNSAIITWTTDQAANSLVQFGTSTSYGLSSGLNAAMSTTHSATLSGLTPGTTYNYTATSANASGNSTTSPNFSFATTSQAPVMSALTVSGITGTSATITWTTDQSSSTQVVYGTSSSYGSASTLSSILTAYHTVTLSGLTPGTTYNFSARSANAAGMLAASPNTTFATTAQAPVISGVAATAITATSATITWTTDQASSSQVQYGLSNAYGNSSALNSTLATSHSVTLSGLTPGTTYTYSVVSANAAGNTANSANQTFLTLTQAPVISNVTASGITNTSATITWTTSQTASSQVQYGTTSAYGSSSAANPALVSSHSVTLTGLTPGTTYNYAAVSTNSAGTATSGNFTFATVSQAPVISAVNATVNGTSATITWTTDQASSSQVQYGTSSTYDSSSSLNSSLVTNHSVTLNGLAAGTNYNYSVVSANSAGTSAASANFTFATAAPAANPPSNSANAPQISYLAYWGVSGSSVTISWSTNVPATTAVAYGVSSALGQMSAVATNLSSSHGVVLSGLTSGTTYYFVAQSADANGNMGYSAVYSFSTVNQNPPTISNIVTTPGSNHSAAISWTTSTPAVSWVSYGPTTSYGRWSGVSPLTTTPQPHIGWVPSGVIHYQLHSRDNMGNQVDSPDYTFVEP